MMWGGGIAGVLLVVSGLFSLAKTNLNTQRDVLVAKWKNKPAVKRQKRDIDDDVD